MQIFCDESGGIGRGVMTLAAVAITTEAADGLVTKFCERIGLQGELKGSRIDLVERRVFFDLFMVSGGKAVVGFAAMALRPREGEDRGVLDRQIYADLVEAAVSILLLESGGCASITIDDGRYAPATLAAIRNDLAAMVGPCGSAALELSHRSAGLQIADVIANTMFNRALPSERQPQFLAIAQPLIDSGQIRLAHLDHG